MTSFADGLRAAILNDRLAHPQSERILAILDEPDSPHKQRRVARMERRIRNEMGLAHDEPVDWSAAGGFDWKSVLTTILSILAKLLPLLLAL